jgi:all-trans-8'-apo-beta-carotenal 15,15'-oxygenase
MHLLTGARGRQALLSRPSSSSRSTARAHRVSPSLLPQRRSWWYYDSSPSSIPARALPSTATTTTTTTREGAAEEQRGASSPPSPSPPPSPPRATQQTLDDVKSLLQSLPIEYDYELSFSGSANGSADAADDASAAAPPATLEGALPPGLVGSFFRNGPGLLVDTPAKHGHRHAFDGDGVVVRFSFSGGGGAGGAPPRVRLRNRFVRTSSFDEEQRAKKPLYRSSFTRGGVGGSAWFNPFDFAVKNTANTSLLWWAGRLAALFEAGLAHLVDPKTLNTTARDSRIFDADKAAIDSATIGAHYRVCSFTGRLVLFSVGPGVPDARVSFFELNENGERVCKATAALPGTRVPLVHDFAITENYYVLVEGPVKLDMRRFFLEYPFGKSAIAETLVFDPQQKARVHLIPRAEGRFAGHPPRVLDAPSAFFAFHLGNAYEVERGEASKAARAYAQGVGGEGDNNGLGDDDEADDDGGAPLVVVDALAWDSVDFSSFNYSVLEGDPQPIKPDYYEGGARTTLVRLVVDPLRPAAGGGGRAPPPPAGKVSAHRLLRRTAEFPQVDPSRVGRPHSAVFLGADALDDDVSWRPLHAVVRLDVDPLEAVAQSYAVARGWAPLPEGAASALEWRLDEGAGSSSFSAGRRLQSWDAGHRTLIMEQLFVPRASSDDLSAPSPTRREGEGFLVGTGYDAEKKKGVLLVFDAERVSEGPLAKITLGHHLPSGLHSVFVPGETFGAFDQGAGLAEKPRRVVTY